MADIRAVIKQVNDTVDSDNSSTFKNVRMTRDHAMQTNTREGLIDMWTRAGFVFEAHNPVLAQAETMSAAGTDVITATAPSIRFTVPSGLTVAPIFVEIKPTGTTAKDQILEIVVSDTDTFTSGGDAVLMTARNMLIQSNSALQASAVTNLHYSDTAIVEATLTRPRVLKLIKKEGVTSNVADHMVRFVYNVLDGDPMPYIVGPASFLVYFVEESAPSEAEWTMMWAELPTGTVGA